MPFRATDRQTALTRTSAASVGEAALCSANCTFDGSAGDSADFPPLASSLQTAEASVSRDSSYSQLLEDNELDLLQTYSLSVVVLLSPTKGPLKESGKTRADLAKAVVLLQALLSIFGLPIAKSLTLLLPILLN